jgi:hypothetical protein
MNPKSQLTKKKKKKKHERSAEKSRGRFIGDNPMRGGASREKATREQLKRVAPDGGGPYSRDEFVQFYGGTDEWDAAEDSDHSSNGVGSDEDEFEGQLNPMHESGSPL